jgi:hypothetical protein
MMIMLPYFAFTCNAHNSRCGSLPVNRNRYIHASTGRDITNAMHVLLSVFTNNEKVDNNTYSPAATPRFLMME